jgi:hypothetical protein
MNSKLLIGSVVYGAAGIGCKVLAIEGDTLTLETPKGTRTISSSKVAKVILPRPKAFKLGDRVEYIGSDFNLKKQYAGTLEVWEISKNPLDGYTCLKSNGRTTSWVQFEDLELAIEVTPNTTGLEGDLWA